MTEDEPGLQANTYTFLMEEGMARAMGLLPTKRPTEEEARANHERAVEWWRARVAAWETYDAAAEQLAAVTDPLARAVLDLHQANDHGLSGLACRGCEYGGFEGEPPDYPCSTVRLVAEQYDVPMPEAWILNTRPAAEPPAYVSPEDWTPPRPLYAMFPSAFVDLDRDLFDPPKEKKDQ